MSTARIPAAQAAVASGATSGEPDQRSRFRLAVDRVDGVAQVVGDGVGGDDEAPGEPESFEAHIRRLFRDRDSQSMSFAFERWTESGARP